MRARRLVLFFFSVMCVATIASIAPRPASAYDHVRNGSFESSTDGWIVRGDATLTTAGVDETAPVEGSRVAKVAMSEARFETLTVTASALDVGAYNVSAAVFAVNDGMLAGTSLVSGTSHLRPLTPGTWTTIEFTANVTLPARATLSIVATGQPGDVLYFDAVHIDGAPPVTLTPTSTPGLPQTPAPDVTGTPAPATPTAEPTPAATIDVIANHLRNASFEETTVDGLPFAWQKFGGTLSTSPAHPRSGALAARIDSNTASTKWLYQTVLVDPLETYAFATWIYHDDPNVASVFLRISWYASQDGSGEAIASDDSPQRLDAPSSDYRHLTTGPLTAPPDARSAKLRIMLAPASATPATIFADDVSFAVTEPPPSDATPVTAPASAAASSRQAGTTRTRPTRTSSGAAFDAPQHLASYDGGASLVINEVLYDPDTNAGDAAGEWIEIYNAGAADVPLAGWSLRDNARTVALPDVIVPARNFAIITASDSFFVAYPEFEGLAAWLDSRIGNGLGNDGDRLELLAPDATVVDAISWGDESSVFDPPIDDVPSGHSIERRIAGTDTDAADDFVDNDLPSPGVAFEAVETNSKQRIGASGVEIIESARDGRYAWAPWALVAISAAALAGSVGWRALDFVRARSRST